MLYQLSHFRSMHRPGTGAESQIRTGDTAIFSRVLYQLSYLGPVSEPPRGPVGGAEDTMRPDRAARKAPASGRSTARVTRVAAHRGRC